MQYNFDGKRFPKLSSGRQSDVEFKCIYRCGKTLFYFILCRFLLPTHSFQQFLSCHILHRYNWWYIIPVLPLWLCEQLLAELSVWVQFSLIFLCGFYDTSNVVTTVICAWVHSSYNTCPKLRHLQFSLPFSLPLAPWCRAIYAWMFLGRLVCGIPNKLISVNVVYPPPKLITTGKFDIYFTTRCHWMHVLLTLPWRWRAPLLHSVVLIFMIEAETEFWWSSSRHSNCKYCCLVFRNLDKKEVLQNSKKYYHLLLTSHISVCFFTGKNVGTTIYDQYMNCAISICTIRTKCVHFNIMRLRRK